MSWVKLSDDFYRNDKQLAMSDAAFRVFVCALTYAMHAAQPTGYLSDMEVAALIRYLKRSKKVRHELVQLRAWEEAIEGILIHDFDQYVPKTSTERVRAFRAMKRFPSVSETFQKPDETIKGRPEEPAGNVSETPRVRAARRVPVPVVTTTPNGVSVTPVPGPVKENSKESPETDWDWAALCDGAEQVFMHQLSASDKELAHKILAEANRLSVQEMVEVELPKFMDWWEVEGINRRPNLKDTRTWFAKANHAAADAGRLLAMRGESSTARGGEYRRAMA